jgi:hypothetical protein
MQQQRYVTSHNLLRAINHTLIHFISFIVCEEATYADARDVRLGDYHKNLTYGTHLIESPTHSYIRTNVEHR